MNRIVVTGRLTFDPKVLEGKDGTSKGCSFNMATDKWTKDGKVAEYYYVTYFGTRAEACMKYLSKGKQVAVVGELSASIYTGKGEPRVNLSIRADNVEFLGSKDDAEGDSNATISDLGGVEAPF